MTPPKRPGTRDDLVRKTPPKGIAEQIAAPEFVCDDVTGQYEGDELLEMRRRRAEEDPAHRIALIETEQKEQRKLISATRDDVAGVKLSVSEIKGDQKAHGVKLDSISTTLQRMATREDAAYVEKKKLATAEKLDSIDARKARRDFWMKMVGGFIAGGGIMKLLAWIGVF